jgi:hypothetical protein
MADLVASLRAVASRYCAWCESPDPVGTTDVHAAIRDVLEIYLLCAGIPRDLSVTEEPMDGPRPADEVTERLTARVNTGIAVANAAREGFAPSPEFHPRGLDSLYEWMVLVRDRADWTDDVLFSVRMSYADQWGGPVLADLAWLHDAFVLPVV